MCRRGHRVTIVTARVPDGGVPERYLQGKEGVPRVIHVPGALLTRHWLRGSAREKIRQLLTEHEALHLHGVWDFGNVQLAEMAREMGKPYFVSVRGMLDDWSVAQKYFKKRAFLAATRRRYLDRAAEIHLTAEGELEQACKWFDRRKGTVIPNLLDLGPYRDPPGPELARRMFPVLDGGVPAVLFLSRVHYKKGPEVLIEAAGLLRKRGVDAAYVIAGACDDEYRIKLSALAQSCGVGDRVHFIGHVEASIKISVYQAARVMALPTSQENFGFVFPESLASGTPVITTKGVDIWPTLERGGGAMIVERSPAAFADAIERILKDPILRDGMSRDGRSFVFEEYNETKIVEQFESMYRRSRLRTHRLSAAPRITHFVDSTDLRGGGVPRVVLDIAGTLSKAGRPSIIMTCETLDTPAAWLANSKPSSEPGPIDPMIPAVYKLAANARMKSAIADSGMLDVVEIIRRSDVVHLHCVWSVANLQIANLCRILGVPYVLTTHGMLDDWSMKQGELKKLAYLRLGGRAMMEAAAFVLCTAAGEIDQSHKRFPRGNGRVLTYIIDLEPYRELPGEDLARQQFPQIAQAKERGEPIVLFLSRLHYKKGCDLLIKAAKRALDRGIAATYVFAGTGDERYINGLKELATTLGISDRVHFVGMVKGQVKVSLYEASDLFVLPTSQENFGLVLIESMACNTPVVTTRGTDIWKDIESSQAGVIVDQTDAAIADQLCLLFSDKSRLRELGRGARDWVFENYDETLIVGKYVALYEEAARSSARKERSLFGRTFPVLRLLGKHYVPPEE
ncbi:hypothetical protein LBMAG48_06620 [Phycisphaerae bacterium]|nr:hypothetical protein LBMAG48_06620 [Phycisphaerae bacterium]